jgi:hypothetical protein
MTTTLLEPLGFHTSGSGELTFEVEARPCVHANDVAKHPPLLLEHGRPRGPGQLRKQPKQIH